MSDAVGSAPVSAPLSGHELLLWLAGRVDDDLLAVGRELVAVGEEAAALEMIVATLAAARTALPQHVRDGLADVVVRRLGPGSARLLPAGAAAVDAHRFVPEVGVPEVVEQIARIVGGLAIVSRSGARPALAWRLTPAGAAPGPLPHPVLLLVLSDPAPAEVLAYQVGAALERAGVAASVEAFVAGPTLPPYQRQALAASRRLDPSAGGDPAVDDDPGATVLRSDVDAAEPVGGTRDASGRPTDRTAAGDGETDGSIGSGRRPGDVDAGAGGRTGSDPSGARQVRPDGPLSFAGGRAEPLVPSPGDREPFAAGSGGVEAGAPAPPDSRDPGSTGAHDSTIPDVPVPDAGADPLRSASGSAGSDPHGTMPGTSGGDPAPPPSAPTGSRPHASGHPASAGAWSDALTPGRVVSEDSGSRPYAVTDPAIAGSERSGSEQPGSEQPRSEQPRSEQPRSEQPRSEQPRSTQSGSNQVGSNHVETGRVGPGQVESAPVRSGPIGPPSDDSSQLGLPSVDSSHPGPSSVGSGPVGSAPVGSGPVGAVPAGSAPVGPAAVEPARFDPARDPAGTGHPDAGHTPATPPTPGADGRPPVVANGASGANGHPSPRPTPRPSPSPGPSNGTSQNATDEQEWADQWSDGSWSMPGGVRPAAREPDPDMEPVTSPTPTSPPLSRVTPSPVRRAPDEPERPRRRHRLDAIDRPDVVDGVDAADRAVAAESGPLPPVPPMPPQEVLDSRLTPNEQELLRRLQEELAAREGGGPDAASPGGTDYPPERPA